MTPGEDRKTSKTLIKGMTLFGMRITFCKDPIQRLSHRNRKNGNKIRNQPQKERERERELPLGGDSVRREQATAEGCRPSERASNC